MVVVKVILTILFLLVCVALIGIVLVQEGKSSGLAGLTGQNDTYWSKNKDRSVEGKLQKFTKIAAVAFFVLALVLNLF